MSGIGRSMGMLTEDQENRIGVIARELPLSDARFLRELVASLRAIESAGEVTTPGPGHPDEARYTREKIDELQRKLEDVRHDYEEELERRRVAEARLRMTRVELADAWLWQPEDEEANRVESLSCPVVIAGSDLRAIVRAREQHWAAYVGAEAMLRASQQRERVTQQHRVDACDRERQLHDRLRVMEQDLARACSFLTNDFEPATTERIHKLLEQDQQRMLAGTERLRRAEERVEDLEGELQRAVDEKIVINGRAAQLDADVEFWKRMTVRARCGCLGLDCCVHGAFDDRDSDRVIAEIGERRP